MAPFLEFLLFVMVVFIFIIGVITVPLWADRVVVWVMRTCRIYAYPLAIRLALSLETQEDEWALTDDKLSHPTIGTVRVTDKIRVSLKDTNQSIQQVWQPDWIERRIIRDAAISLIVRRRTTQLDRALPRLPGL